LLTLQTPLHLPASSVAAATRFSPEKLKALAVRKIIGHAPKRGA